MKRQEMRFFSSSAEVEFEKTAAKSGKALIGWSKTHAATPPPWTCLCLHVLKDECLTFN